MGFWGILNNPPSLAYCFATTVQWSLRTSAFAFCLFLFACSSTAKQNTVQLPDGSQYEGGLKDGLFQGPGTLTWPNGDYYSGEFSLGMFSGQGELIRKDGDRYVGTFVAGLYHGQGTLTAEDDSIYEGQFAEGIFHGSGTKNYQNGDRYEGQWQNGEFHGQGKFSSNAGDSFTGEFVEGSLTGQGEFSGSDNRSYKGEFKDWQFHGQGIYESEQEGRYEGNFEQGQLAGVGSHRNPDGDIYQGEFTLWRYHGQGVLTLSNGDIYSGGFRYGRYSGKGELRIGSTGELQQGQFEEGRLVLEQVQEKQRYQPSSAEQALYLQNHLLEQQIQSLVANNPKLVEGYFLLVGGDGSQSVFKREVEYISQVFAERFEGEGKTLALLNHRDTTGEFPLATVTSIDRAIQSLAEQMDPDQDILVTYFTSHGTRDHRFYINQPGLELNNLAASQLATMLERIPVKHKVIIISACFSGGFIDHLKDEHTMILTSARHDNVSFGCSDDSEFTYFGRAFFANALQYTSSFRDAFHLAFKEISRWEAEDEYDPSIPQIYTTDAISKQMEIWLERLPAAPEPLPESNLVEELVQWYRETDF